MVDLQKYLDTKLRKVITSWKEGDIYAISFLVYANEAYEYGGYANLPHFSISYHTEHELGRVDALSEKRWNYAFWPQDETPIIDTADEESMRALLAWYKENGIDHLGYEDPTSCYDDKMRYIGKGPGGYAELLAQITAVAADLQTSGYIRKKFGRPIPIIIHDYEYSWYTVEATKTANPNGEANTFLAAMKQLGLIE